ncbi:class I SAM-dependent methyltransferase [Legionella sp. 27cVA30]|uniref:methyltransferase domain-containing protein n=1 Tax=Legionella sp. 27cVA30 TaxID=2905657 RepID=UPI00209C91F8|nr:class I SAM-dependent methyltransferase [Legionella sp. 27cVA30]MCP0913854.1 class I SAM-dependent methyltransferase [Legionella sp. 27cVA30]
MDNVSTLRPLVHKTYTCMHRYRELFLFLQQIHKAFDLNFRHILSFGCSSGEECLTLKELFPNAKIFGTDILSEMVGKATEFCALEANINILPYETFWQDNDQYDLVCCMSVLLELQYQFMKKPHWHTLVENEDPQKKLLAYELVIKNLKLKFPFSEFENIVTLLDTRVRPGGILVLHNTNYRFLETKVGANYDPIILPGKNYETIPKWHANDEPVFHDYTEVIFRKAR